MKKILILLVVAGLGLGVAGCGKKKAPPPADKYLDQAFKTKQRAKAVESYEELLSKYPDSEFADEAKQRLEVLKR